MPEVKSLYTKDISPEIFEEMITKHGLPFAEGVTEIKEIVRRGNHKLAYYLIKKAEEMKMYNYSKLHWEALKEEGEPTRVLNVSILKKNFKENITPLHVACINPNIKPLKKMLSINPATDVSDREGYRPIHYAAACVSEAPLKYLLDNHNVNPNASIFFS